jgi:hypothetical protein
LVRLSVGGGVLNISDEARQHPGIVNGRLIKRDGPPRLDFLDEAGKVVYSLPEEGKAGGK